MSQFRPLIIGIEGVELTPNERAAISDLPPFGVILFARNIDTPARLRALTENVADLTNGFTQIFIDQEGGRVQRLAEPYWPRYPRPVDIVNSSEDFYEVQARVGALYRLIADDLVRVGIRINCAPTLDLQHQDTHSFLQDRIFGSNADIVTKLGAIALDEMEKGGVAGVIKHAPGHGRSTQDTHFGLPTIRFGNTDYVNSGPLPEDMRPFAALSSRAMMMTSHIVFDEIDPDAPITLSPKGIRFLRDRLGAKGLITTDDIGMEALSGEHYERARMAKAAGVDMIMHCSGKWHELGPILGDVEVNSLPSETYVKSIAYMSSLPRVSYLSDEERADLARVLEPVQQYSIAI